MKSKTNIRSSFSWNFYAKINNYALISEFVGYYLMVSGQYGMHSIELVEFYLESMLCLLESVHERIATGFLQ